MANNQITPFQLTDQFTMDNFNQRINETNIALQNKAPAGYGLGGGSKLLTASDDLNTISASGWYYWRGDKPQNAPTDYSIMRVDTGADGNIDWCRQTVMMGSKSTKLERCCVGASESVWQPWEYANPPMELGVEYRTTEMYLGKPVYVKAVDCGASGSAGTTKAIAHNISNMKDVVDYGGSRNNSTGNAPESIPNGRGSNSRTYVNISPSTIYIYTVDDNTQYTDTKVWIKYTKITD